jgi:hypothetical protein
MKEQRSGSCHRAIREIVDVNHHEQRLREGKMETLITIVNDCSRDKVGGDYAPIIDEAVGACGRTLEKLLISIRLVGSVPRSDASYGVSDIDFAALVSMNPGADQRSMLAVESRRLSAMFPCVSHVDLEIEIKGRVTAAREFVFRSDSICVWGDDIYAGTETRTSNVALAKLTTPDFDKLVAGYRQRLKNPIQADELGHLCRSASKDLLRCFRKYLLLKLAIYRKGAADIHDQLVTYFPGETETFGRLLAIYGQPVERREDLLDILKSASETFRKMEKAAV